MEVIRGNASASIAMGVNIFADCKGSKVTKNFPILASLYLCDFALKETCLVAARPR